LVFDLALPDLIMTDVEKSNELAQIESAAAPQGMRYVHIDESVQKRVKRKLDMNLMPLVVALCKLPESPKNSLAELSSGYIAAAND